MRGEERERLIIPSATHDPAAPEHPVAPSARAGSSVQ